MSSPSASAAQDNGSSEKPQGREQDEGQGSEVIVTQKDDVDNEEVAQMSMSRTGRGSRSKSKQEQEQEQEQK